MTLTIPTDGRIDLDALAELAGPLRAMSHLGSIEDGAIIAQVGEALPALIDIARRAEAKADDRPDPTPDAAFAAWVASLPKESWAKYDLSACRLGWDAARRAAIPFEQGEAAGEAGTMPGTDGFTMAVFRAADVPVGTKLYTHPAPAAGVKVREREGAIVAMAIELEKSGLFDLVKSHVWATRLYEAALDQGEPK